MAGHSRSSPIFRPDTLTWGRLGLWVLIATGALLRLAPIADDPLHPDECLYASWSMLIASGDDPWLTQVVIDKPPGLPYLLALWSLLLGTGPVAMRSLGAVASVAGMVAFAATARRYHGPWAAFSGLALLALSPVCIALDATALTDAPAIALALVGAYAAASGRGLPAGVLLGLSIATKPQMVAYLPLVTGAIRAGSKPLSDTDELRPPANTGERPGAAWLSGAAGLLLVLAGVAAWEVYRAAPRGFVEAAIGHYGLRATGNNWDSLLRDWAGLLRWIWGAPWATALWLLSLACAGLAWLWRRPPRSSGDALALGAAASLALYLAANLALGVPAWDRYALPLVPLGAFLLTWTASQLARLPLKAFGTWLPAAIGLAMIASLAAPAREAARSMLPLGDTSRWQGIDSVASYVRGQVPGRSTILHREFGWHLQYYMAGFPQDFRWVTDVGELVDIAGRAENCYLLVSADEAGVADLAALTEAGFSLALKHVGYRHSGQPSILLYAIRKATTDDRG